MNMYIMVRNTRRRRRRGGMMTALKPLGQASLNVGKAYGKDWLKTKSVKVVEGVYQDPSLATDVKFMLYGKKPVPVFRRNVYDDENKENNKAFGNRGGTHKRRRSRRHRRTYKRVK